MPLTDHLRGRARMRFGRYAVSDENIMHNCRFINFVASNQPGQKWYTSTELS